MAALSFGSCKSKQEAVEKTAVTEAHKQADRGDRADRSPREGRSGADRFARLDVNNDGKLSKEEMKGPLAEKFDLIDTDKDGFISKEELEKSPRPQRGGRGGGH